MPNTFFTIGPHWLPVGVFITLPGTFFLTYGIAVSLGHTEIDFPYISDTGAYSPESCIFAQFLNIGAVFVALCIYVRYCQVHEYNAGGPPLLTKVNNVSFWIGILAAFGISVVGNFQESNVIVVHVIGAAMAFGLGMVYAWMTTFLSYKMHPRMNSIFVCHIRFAVCALCTACFVTTFIAGAVAMNKFTGSDATKWNSEDGGFAEHLISTISEWVMAIAFMMYFLTFIKEFQKVSLSLPAVTLEVDTLMASSQVDASSQAYS